MAKFYALANGENGQALRINFDDMDKHPQTHFQAEKIAKTFCAKNGLKYTSTHVIQGTQKQGSTMTKFKNHRSKHGNNGRGFAKAL